MNEKTTTHNINNFNSKLFKYWFDGKNKGILKNKGFGEKYITLKINVFYLQLQKRNM